MDLLFGIFTFGILFFTALAAKEDFGQKQVAVWKTASILIFAWILFVYCAVRFSNSHILIEGIISFGICFLTNICGLWGSADGKALYGLLAITLCLFQPTELLGYMMVIAVALLFVCIGSLSMNHWSKIRETDKPYELQTVAVVPGFFIADLGMIVLYVIGRSMGVL